MWNDFTTHNVTISDARKHRPGSFKETGFSIITLDEVDISHISKIVILAKVFHNTRILVHRTGGQPVRISICSESK